MTVAPPASVVERLGVRLDATGDGPDPNVLLGLALRDNPRRAHLLVSRVLGKHVPTDPRLVRVAGLLLGGLVADALTGRPARPLPTALLHAAVRGEPGAAAALLAGVAPRPVDALVLGFAETATALGHSVAEALGGADYLHSTRRPVPGTGAAGTFTEEHSHHTDHLLLPSDLELLTRPRPLVLVDDELSTGRTAVNTIVALHAVAPREHYVVAALVDLRPDALVGLPDDVRVDVVALTGAAVTLPADLPARAAAVRAELAQRPTAAADRISGPPRRVALTDLGWPVDLPAGGRHGFTTTHHRTLAATLPGVAAKLAQAAEVRPDERTLVLGTEELMAIPLALAAALTELQQGPPAATGLEQGPPAAIPSSPGPAPSTGHGGVRFSSTTRSPALVVDEPGYALTSGITFPAHDSPADGPGPRYAYNVAQEWDHVLVVVDPPADTPELGGLLAALAPHTRRTTVVVTP